MKLGIKLIVSAVFVVFLIVKQNTKKERVNIYFGYHVFKRHEITCNC